MGKRVFQLTVFPPHYTVVLIGAGFWDKIGGAGTYQTLLDAIHEVGGEYKARIYREFLGIEPPQ